MEAAQIENKFNSFVPFAAKKLNAAKRLLRYDFSCTIPLWDSMGGTLWKRTKLICHLLIVLKFVKRAHAFDAVKFFRFPVHGQFYDGQTIGGGS
jgi:hypothetical protein